MQYYLEEGNQGIIPFEIEQYGNEQNSEDQ